MTARLIDGRAIAAKLRGRLAEECARLKDKHGITPGLAVVLVGDDPASQIYVRNKGIAAKELGFHSVEHRLPASTNEADLLALVRKLNADPSVHGILVQFPVPPQIRQQAVIEAIDPGKDVDGLHPMNAGLLVANKATLVSCTPVGCMILLRETLGSIAGANATVVGRSLLVGKPIAQLLLNADCTVTSAHSKTGDLPAVCRGADILVVAIGRPHFVKADWIKPGATVLDVGMNRIDAGNGKTRSVGDVDFEAAKERAGAITPVPGGVGPMTVTCLMRNTVLAAAAQAAITVASL
jgi:methylenetetrahydrofolate dehydrogenase (NADP+) / methenyltetrahydrofolate cyclohydrolase